MPKVVPSDPLSSSRSAKRKRPNERSAMPRSLAMGLMLSGDRDMRKHEPTEEELKLDRDDAHLAAEAEKEKRARNALEALESNPADDSEEEDRRRTEKKRVVRKLEVARKKIKKRRVEKKEPPFLPVKKLSAEGKRIVRPADSPPLPLTSEPNIIANGVDAALPIAEQVWHYVEPPVADDPLVHLDRMVCSSEYPKEDRTMVMNKIKASARSGVPRSRTELRDEAFKTQDLQPRDYEDELLRVKNGPDERDCCEGENCQGYKYHKDILRELMFEADRQHYLDTGEIPPPGRCLRCHRYLIQYLKVNTRAECTNSEEDVLYSRYYNIVDRTGEYVPEQTHLSSRQHHQGLPFPVVCEVAPYYKREVRNGVPYHVQKGYKKPEELEVSNERKQVFY